MAGAGTGEESPNGSPLRLLEPDLNPLLTRLSADMIDSRCTAEHTDAAVGKCPSSLNGTTTGKCVTIQQFKEEGAPKYAVVERYLMTILL